MMRTELCISTLLFSLLLTGNALFAQDEDSEDGISERIVTIGDWQPRIGEVEKLKAEPSLVDTVPERPELSYSRIPVRYQTRYHVEPIEAARIRVRDPLDRLKKGYVRLGMGTFTTPLAEAYFSSDRDRDHQYSGRIFHRSSEGGVRNNPFADWSRNGADLRGKWTKRNDSWKAELGYLRDVRHHYGLPTKADTMDILEQETLRQRFHDFRGKLQWNRYNSDSNETDHDIGLEVHHFRTLEEAQEWHGVLDLSFDRYVEEEHLKLDAGVDHNSYWSPGLGLGEEEEPPDPVHNALVHLTPKILSQGDGWKVEVGMKVLSDLGREASFHFYPEAEAHYVLFDGIFVPYAGLKGDKQRNNLRSFARWNPHIHSHQELRNSNERYDLYGGIRGSLGPRMNFDLRASKRKLEDMPLLVNDTLFSAMNRFGMVYDDGEIITVRGDLSYYEGERFKLNLSGAYHSYRLDNEVAAWHRPVFEAAFNGWYDIQDKFTVSARVKYNAPRKARELRPLEDAERVRDVYVVELEDYVDLNLGFEYRYTEDLSAFLRFNNILSSRYQRWYRYPVQGFQVLGGLSYSF